MYIPNGDFTHFAFTFNQLYPKAGTEDGFECSYSNNFCRFNKTCTEIQGKYSNIPFSIELNDVTSNKFNLTTKEHGMLVDGANFGMAKDEYCYIPVFRHEI